MKLLCHILFFVLISSSYSQSILWYKVENSFELENVFTSDMNEDGTIIIAGTEMKSNQGNQHFGSQYVVKYSNNGELVYKHSFEGNLIINHILLQEDGYLISGYIDTFLTLNSTSITESGLFVIKVNDDANILWSYHNSNYNEVGSKIVIDNDNNVYVMNFPLSFQDESIIIKLNNFGEEIQTKNLPFGVFLNDITIDNNNNIYAAGMGDGNTVYNFDSIAGSLTFNGRIVFKNFVVKYDESMEAQWIIEKEGFDGDQHQRIEYYNGFVYWIHMENPDPSFTNLGLVLSKINSESGDRVSSTKINEGHQVYFFGHDVSIDNDIIKTIKPKNNNDELPPQIVSYDTDLNHISSFNVDTFYESDLIMNSKGDKTIIGGKVSSNASINLNNEAIIESTTNNKLFTTMLISNALSTLSLNKKDFNIYPNPFTDYIYIQGLDNKKYYITIYNLTGKKLTKKKLLSNQGVHWEQLKNGVYFFTIQNLKRKVIKKGVVIKK